MRVLVFGDSVAQGFWDLEGGWVGRLRRHYDQLQLQDLKGDQPTVFNLGISGDTAQAVVKRLALETRARVWDKDAIVIIIAIGLNDSLVFKGAEANTLELYKGELQQIIAAATQYTDKVLFVGMTACDETKTSPVGWDEFTFTNDRIWKFEQALRAFCKDNELPIVRVFEKFQGKTIEGNLLADGLHPNEQGHELIAKLVRPQLEKLIS